MKALTFERLTINNFKQFKDTTEIILDRPGVTFLRGRNLQEPSLGSNSTGKSSIWGALTWCLFGTTQEGLHNTDVTPWDGKGPTWVALTLNTTSYEYIIDRSTSPNRLTLNGVVVGQERINNLIGMSKETFMHTVLFGQDKPLFFDLKPREKMELFSDVLDLTRWDERSAAASIAATDIEHKQTALTTELSVLERQREEAEQHLEAIQEHSDAWTKENSKSFDDLATKIAAKEKILEALMNEMATADVGYDGAVTEYKALEKEFSRTLRATDEARTVLQEENSKKLLLLAEAKRLADELKQFDLGTCPTCGQSISGTELHKHIDRIKETWAIKVKEAKLLPRSETKERYDDLTHQSVLIGEDERKFRGKADGFHEQQLHLAPKIAEVKGQLVYLEEAKANRPTNPHKIRIRDLQLRISQINKQLADINRESSILEKKLVRTKRWVKGFKDIRLYLVEDVLSELTLVTASMIDATGLLGWKVEYTIEKETKTGTIQNALHVLITSPSYDKPVKWESWSGGVSQRLRLIGALALGQVLLNRAGVSTNLQVLDEPTRSLSTQGVDSLCRMLADYARDTGTSVWFIDHHALETSAFTSSVTVVKDQSGFAHIEMK